MEKMLFGYAADWGIVSVSTAPPLTNASANHSHRLLLSSGCGNSISTGLTGEFGSEGSAGATVSLFFC